MLPLIGEIKCIYTSSASRSMDRTCASGPGNSKDPCSEQYNGWQTFSEPETRAIADFILSLTSATSPTNVNDDNDVGGLLIYVSLHSYGQHLLTPWGYTHRLPSDYLDLVSSYSHTHDTCTCVHKYTQYFNDNFPIFLVNLRVSRLPPRVFFSIYSELVL